MDFLFLASNWLIERREYYSAIKKEWNNAICNNVDGPGDNQLSEVSQRKTDIIWYCFYMEYKKNDTDELTYKTEIDSQT